MGYEKLPYGVPYPSLIRFRGVSFFLLFSTCGRRAPWTALKPPPVSGSEKDCRESTFPECAEQNFPGLMASACSATCALCFCLPSLRSPLLESALAGVPRFINVLCPQCKRMQTICMISYGGMATPFSTMSTWTPRPTKAGCTLTTCR